MPPKPYLISLQGIERTINCVESKHKEKSLILRNSIVNPSFAFLFEYNGILSNLRFYNPYVKSIIENESRQYSLDSSDCSFSKLLFELFPSPSGTLDIWEPGNSENFASVIRQSEDEGIKFLADIFVQVLVPKKALPVEHLPNHFRKITNLFLSKSSLFDSETIKALKLLSLHSFVINLVNSDEEFANYLELVLAGVDKAHTYDFNWDAFKIISETITKINKFPYSTDNKPPSNVNIPIYDRSRKDDKNPFIDNSLFPDCADVLILNICNCLLFDPNTETYSTETLPEGSDIAKFYSNHRSPFKITMDIRKEWSRVVQGLDDFASEPSNPPYNTHLIAYKREKRNEIKSGMINMMNVLIKIFHLDHRVFWSNFRGQHNMEKKLKDLFSTINPNFQDRSLEIRLDTQNLSEFKSMDRKDFSGSFKMIFNLPDNAKITMNITHFHFHAEMNFLSYENRNYEEETITDVYFSLSNTVPEILIKRFFESNCNIMSIDSELDILKEIIFTENLNTNESKRYALEKIFENLIDNKMEKNTVKNLKEMVNNILSTVALSDPATRERFRAFLVLRDDLSRQEILDSWSLSYGMRNLKIYKLWNKKLINSNIENVRLKLSGKTDRRIIELFTTLKKCSKLKSIDLYGISTECQVAVFFNLENLENLKGLNVSECEMNVITANALGNMLEKMKNLEILCLTNNHINFDNLDERTSTKSKLTTTVFIFDGISKLTNLKVLKVSRNSFCCSEYESLLLKLGNLNLLEEINFSNNALLIKPEDVERICKIMAKMPNLAIIDFSCNSIGPDQAQSIAKAIANVPNLSIFRFSNNKIGFNGAYHLSKSFKNLEKLTELTLDNNDLKSDGVRLVVESLIKSPGLRKLDLSFNDMGAGETEAISSQLGNMHALEELYLH